MTDAAVINNADALVRTARYNMFLSLWTIIKVVSVTLRISLPTVIDELLRRTSVETCNRRLQFWAKRLVSDAHIQLEISGREHIKPNQLYIVMSNHQSLYDIPVAFCALEQPLRMVAKKDLFKVPIWGGAMKASGFIEVDRHNRVRAIENLKQAGNDMVKNQVNVWIAPEGTRSNDGRLGAFKSGGFHLAKQTGLPILPLVIDGTRHVMPARSLSIHHHQPVRATFGPALDPNGADIKDLMASVQTFMLDTLKQN